MLTVNSLSGFGSRAAFATVVIPGSSDWMNVDSDLTFGTGTLEYWVNDFHDRFVVL
mgnify:CR=1 FL=1